MNPPAPTSWVKPVSLKKRSRGFAEHVPSLHAAKTTSSIPKLPLAPDRFGELLDPNTIKISQPSKSVLEYVTVLPVPDMTRVLVPLTSFNSGVASANWPNAAASAAPRNRTFR